MKKKVVSLLFVFPLAYSSHSHSLQEPALYHDRPYIYTTRFNSSAFSLRIYHENRRMKFSARRNLIHFPTKPSDSLNMRLAPNPPEIPSFYRKILLGMVRIKLWKTSFRSENLHITQYTNSVQSGDQASTARIWSKPHES